MIKLSETEINAVSGAFGSTPVRSYPGSEAPSIIAQLSAQNQPWDPDAHLRAYQVKACRAANPDSPTWYADFFGL